MATIALIACSKTKARGRHRALEMYTSPLFRKSLLYAVSNSDKQFVLSARHGLLAPNDWIEPYEQTLKTMPERQRAAWAKKVLSDLTKVSTKRDKIIFLAGEDYTEGLVEPLRDLGYRIEFPLCRKSLGARLQLLVRLNQEAQLKKNIHTFYSLMRELYRRQNGGRRLADCTGRMDWPSRGVYFFIEDNQVLETNRYEPLKWRITRVGTHAVSSGSRTTLWDRLKTHKGVSSGGGSHRSSIFRLHLGLAFVAAGRHKRVASWGVGQTAEANQRKLEATLEEKVSIELGKMRVLWIAINDEPRASSDRSYIERNVIGLLSRAAILWPDKTDPWLGSLSKNWQISLSGLWNLNHLFERDHKDLLTILQKYISTTTSGFPPLNASIAPSDWYNQDRKTDSNQLTLDLNDSRKPSKK